jgi:putative serine protease PepD
MTATKEDPAPRVGAGGTARARSRAGQDARRTGLTPATPAAGPAADGASAEAVEEGGGGASGTVPALLRPSPGARLLAAVVLAALIGMVGGGLAAWAIYQHFGPVQRTVPEIVPGRTSNQGTSIGQLAQSRAASLVTIATQPVSAASLAGGAAGFANGVVVSADGLILTSAHAVQGASQLRVGLAGGQGYDAVIAASDPAHGLVVLRAVGASGLTPVPVASAAPAVGDTAVAIFSSPGAGLSVGVGTVSAVGQTVTTDTTTGAAISGVTTIDATPQPESDGAPVLNSAGQLIGVVTSVTQATPPPGIAALSFDAIRTLLTQATGGVSQPAGSFGAVSTYLDPAHAAAAGLTPGALIESVTPGGPAATAGLTAGDIVTSVNGVAITATQPFDPASLDLAPGDSAAVSVVRAGTALTLTVVVGTAS